MKELCKIVVIGLASYRLAMLLTWDEGPGMMFLHFRSYMGVYNLDASGKPDSFTGRLFACPYCAGVWTSFALLLLSYVWGGKYLILGLSITGVQFALERNAKDL